MSYKSVKQGRSETCVSALGEHCLPSNWLWRSLIPVWTIHHDDTDFSACKSVIEISWNYVPLWNLLNPIWTILWNFQSFHVGWQHLEILVDRNTFGNFKVSKIIFFTLFCHRCPKRTLFLNVLPPKSALYHFFLGPSKLELILDPFLTRFHHWKSPKHATFSGSHI